MHVFKTQTQVFLVVGSVCFLLSGNDVLSASEISGSWLLTRDVIS